MRGECAKSSFGSFAVLGTPKECHQYCIDQGNCAFFTHYRDSNRDGDENDAGCFAYRNCGEILDECADCISGSVDCPLLGEVKIARKKQVII